MAALLPLPAVEGLECKTLKIYAFQAANVDVDLVRVRTRNVIGVNTADRTKIVLGRLGVELVEDYCIRGSEQAESFRLDNQMQKPFLGANRTITINDPFKVGGDLESDPAAMAASLISRHIYLVSDQLSAVSYQQQGHFISLADR